jgi:hypothetical protein
VAGIPCPPTAADIGGTLPAASEVEMSELATLPAEAWPCCLASSTAQAGGVGLNPTIGRQVSAAPSLSTNKQHKKTLLTLVW